MPKKDSTNSPQKSGAMPWTLCPVISSAPPKLHAGRYAKTVKDNYQLKGETDAAKQVRAIVNQEIGQNALFNASVRPKTIRPILLSRYEPGMSYGWHTDNAVMGDQEFVRSNIFNYFFRLSPTRRDLGTGGARIRTKSPVTPPGTVTTTPRPALLLLINYNYQR